jgi:hypothetical protein
MIRVDFGPISEIDDFTLSFVAKQRNKSYENLEFF